MEGGHAEAPIGNQARMTVGHRLQVWLWCLREERKQLKGRRVQIGYRPAPGEVGQELGVRGLPDSELLRLESGEFVG